MQLLLSPSFVHHESLWAFRVASLGLQVVIWTTLSLVFGALAQRQLEPTTGPTTEPRLVET